MVHLGNFLLQYKYYCRRNAAVGNSWDELLKWNCSSVGRIPLGTGNERY